MSARRALLAVLVPVVTLGVCVAVVLVALARDDDGASPPAGAVRVPLLTGPPLEDAGDSALVAGRLTRDDRGCVVLTSRGLRGTGTRTVAWPGGWTAHDLAGPCGSTTTFVVQSEPEVVPPTPVDLLTGGGRPGTGPSRVVTGTLGLQRGCLTLGRGGERRLTVWPEGWTAGTDPDGVGVVRDADGVVGATTGQPLQVTGTRRGAFAYSGSYDPAPRADAAACGRGAVFVRGVERLPR